MIKILFICHGNICRSPMAEFIMKKMVADAELSDRIYVESAATSSEELDNPVYPPARAELARHGLSCNGKRARQITDRDYENFDYIICMEKYNIRNMKRRLGRYESDPQAKISLLLDYTDKPGDIDDPWYTGLFAEVYDQIAAGCRGLLTHIISNEL